MSYVVFEWVMEHSRERGSSKLVELVLASHANDDGTNAWPSVATMAHKVNVSDRHVPRLLHGLRSRGAIVPTGISPKSTTVYAVVMDLALREWLHEGVTPVSSRLTRESSEW